VQVKIEILDMCKMFLYAKRTESSFSLGNPRNAPLNIDRTKNLSAIVSKRQVVGDQHGKHTSKQRSSLRIFDTSFVFTTIENTQLDHSLIGFLGIIENLIKWLDSTS